MTLLNEKIQEVLLSVLPVTLVVWLTSSIVAPIGETEMVRFNYGALFVVVGLGLFLVGVDIGITPIGQFMGSFLTRTGRVWKLALFSLVLAFLVSVAEPDLHILASHVEEVSAGGISRSFLVLVVSIGVGILLSAGMLRIVNNTPLYLVMAVLYGLVLVLALFVRPEFVSIAFDASGSTTGALTVPVILALSIGASVRKKDRKASEKDSFGLVGVTSTGPIIAVLLIGVLMGSREIETVALSSGDLVETGLLGSFRETLPRAAGEIFLSLLPITLIYVFLASRTEETPLGLIRRSLTGVVYGWLGLTLFVTGVHAGFMDVGRQIGYSLASEDGRTLLVVLAFVLGFMTVLAEPAVHVLTDDIERVTTGSVRKRAVLVALTVGVGFAVALSALRIVVPGIQLWHYLLPGYLFSIALTFVAPKIFVGMAFDAGGVASGPMTATFILAFTTGAAEATEGANALTDGFGMIATVAMMPIITLQILGAIYRMKTRKEGITV